MIEFILIMIVLVFILVCSVFIVFGTIAMSIPWFGWVGMVAIICLFKYLLQVRAEKKEIRRKQANLYHENAMAQMGNDIYARAFGNAFNHRDEEADNARYNEAVKGMTVINVKKKQLR